MRLKKMVLTWAVLTLMVFALSSMTEQTYAYWASGIATPNVELRQDTISVGSWGVIIPIWNPTTTYVTGDLVTWNNRTYEARRTNTNWQPGSGWFWWIFWTEVTT